MITENEEEKIPERVDTKYIARMPENYYPNFKKHKKFMQYADYINKGWTIGSGIIEAACKSVVKQRMCHSGQRWSTKGGQAILNLRATVKSNKMGRILE